MRMAKASKEDVRRLNVFLRFMDEIGNNEPKTVIEDWGEDDEDFGPIIKHCLNDKDEFEYDYFMDYYRTHISHIHMRILMGFEVLVDNCCDPDKDYLDWKPEIKELLEKEEA